jgi:hypothetical protein
MKFGSVARILMFGQMARQYTVTLELEKKLIIGHLVTNISVSVPEIVRGFSTTFSLSVQNLDV